MEILSSIIFYDPYVLNIAAASHSETTSVEKLDDVVFTSSASFHPSPGLVKLTVVTKTLHQVFILSEHRSHEDRE